MNVNAEAYYLAQKGMADLKTAVHLILSNTDEGGLKNSVIGRKLGIYH